MKRLVPGQLFAGALGAVLCAAVVVAVTAMQPATASVNTRAAVKLKEAKLNIEHNATDGHRLPGAIDSEGWKRLDVTGPDGDGADLPGRGTLGEARPHRAVLRDGRAANEDVPIEEMLARLPRGQLHDRGPVHGERRKRAAGRRARVADARHSRRPGARSRPPRARPSRRRGVVASWGRSRRRSPATPVNIIAYQLIIEKDVEPHPHMIGKIGLSMYVPRVGDEHRRSRRVPRAGHGVQLGGAGDRGERQPDTLLGRVPDQVT